MSPSQLDTFTLAYIVVAVTAGLCALLQLALLSRSEDRGCTAILAGSFALKSCAFAFSTPVLYRLIDDWAGVTNLSRLVVDLAHGVGWSAAILVVLRKLVQAEHGRPFTSSLRWHLGIAGVGITVAIMVSLWLGSPTPEMPVPQYAHFDGNVSHAPYMVFYLAVLATGLVAVVRAAWRLARLVGLRWWLRVGLRIAAFGASAHLLVCVARIAVMCGVGLPVGPSGWPLPIPLTLAAGNVLMIVGLSLPAASTLVHTLRDDLRMRCEHLVMRPLWNALYAAQPGIALAEPGCEVGSVAYRLYRRKVEIRDGLIYVQNTPSPTLSELELRAILPAENGDPVVGARHYLRRRVRGFWAVQPGG